MSKKEFECQLLCPNLPDDVGVNTFDKTCFFFHMFFGAVYTAAGSILLICGIYFLIEPPNFLLHSNIITGIYDLAVGIMILLMVSLAAEVSWVKGLVIFYSAISVFVVNIINIVLLEAGEWNFLLENLKWKELNEHPLEINQINSRYGTGITSGIAVIAAFIHANLSYWQVFVLRKGDPDESDEEKSVVRVLQKPDTICTSMTPPLSQYARSWVFDPDNATRNEFPNLKFLSCDSPNTIRHIPDPLRHYSEKQQYTSPPLIKVQVDETSEHYGDGDRQINHMKTFSRTPSPAEASRSSSSISVAPIYECLERLTQPTVYKSRLTSFKNLKDVPIPQVPKSRVSSGDKEHYASLMVELENSFIHKKEPKPSLYAVPSSASKSSTIYSISVCNDNFSDTYDTRQRGSDAEFSKELEAALKLIQDLESPNTLDTPSETRKTIGEKGRSKRRTTHEEKNDSDSSKTLSGCSSLDAHGKKHKTLPVESQSTSGYNSPSLDRSSRFTPTVEISSTDLSVNQDNDLSCVIRYMGDTAVISLFSPSKPFPPSASTEKVSYANKSLNEKDKVNVNDTRTKSLVELTMKNLEKDEKNAKAKIRRWRHFIERKRRPSLLPEVESAIIKSESLAFLSKSELKDRLNQTKSIHRQIEAKVHRQRSLRKADSFGSVEDLMDRHSVSPFL